MSRCVACDKNLTNFETTRKLQIGDGKFYYPDLCNKCFSSTDIANFAQVVERHDIAADDLNEELDIPED